MVVVVAGGEEGGVEPDRARVGDDAEAEAVAVERERPLEVGDAQVHVADAHRGVDGSHAGDCGGGVDARHASDRRAEAAGRHRGVHLSARIGRVTPLIGRARERELLDAALERIGEGGLVVAVDGEPGIGKSRLLAELGERAGAAGCRVVGAAASEFEDDLPYGIWTEALDPYLRSLGDRAISRLGLEDPGALAGFLPALGEPVAVDRHRVHRALRDLLERLAGPRPLVLWLDDLHWADPGSIDALAALVRRPPGGAVLLAPAARERRWPPPLTTALAGAGRDQRVTRLTLAPLSEAEAAELVGRDVAAIYRASGGNPFYLEQLARSVPRAARGSDPLGRPCRSRSPCPSRPSSRNWRPRRASCSTPPRSSATRSIRRWRPRSPSCRSRTR